MLQEIKQAESVKLRNLRAEAGGQGRERYNEGQVNPGEYPVNVSWLTGYLGKSGLQMLAVSPVISKHCLFLNYIAKCCKLESCKFEQQTQVKVVRAAKPESV